MIIVCRRCGKHHDGNTVDECYEWREGHLCMVPDRPSIKERLMARVHDDLPHGDWRRYRSRTQHCECEECHQAWLDHDYGFRM